VSLIPSKSSLLDSAGAGRKACWFTEIVCTRSVAMAFQLYEGYGSASGLVHKGRIGEPFRTGGDHEGHTILRGHDGHLYFISGDGGGTLNRLHITEYTSPVLFERAASVFRISPDGKSWECVSAGGRNPPNLGQNYLGELFSFDSDMEWHVGLPFWRPVRLNHWLAGGDQGWQEVGAYPPYYIDNLAGILDVGRGSPTWGVFYEHTQLPERYRDAFLVCDYRWKGESDDQYITSGRLVSFFLTREGRDLESEDGDTRAAQSPTREMQTANRSASRWSTSRLHPTEASSCPTTTRESGELLTAIRQSTFPKCQPRNRQRRWKRSSPCHNLPPSGAGSLKKNSKAKSAKTGAKTWKPSRSARICHLAIDFALSAF
jgi:hypothetical protein